VSRLRVLRVIARMNVGGPALQVTGLVEGMDADRFDHRLLTGFVEEGEGDYLDLRAPHLPVMRVEGLGRSPDPLDDVRALRCLVREMRAFRPHVVHTHTAKAGVLGRVAARAAGVPVVVHTFHGHLLHGYFSPTVTRAVVQVERTLARGSTRLVAVGDQVRRDLLDAGIGRPEQYVVAPPGIALPAPPPREQARASLGLPSDGLVVAFVARLTQIKRPERFVELARRLAPSHPDVTFVVVGEGDLLDGLQRDASDVGDRLRFLGWRGDVERVYAASDLVVLTSDNEGMPVSLIEAALCGVPAVSTRVGSVAEVVLDGTSGLLIDRPDDHLLAEAVSGLLRDAAHRRAMGEAALAHAQVSFSRGRLVDDTQRLYEQAVLEAGPGRRERRG
jgi:glycosyltransferase involved in cell wall biosynthesis